MANYCTLQRKPLPSPANELSNMTEPTAYELGWLDTIQELRSHTEIEVQGEYPGRIPKRAGDADTAFARLADWYDTTLAEDMKSCFMRFVDLGTCWWFESNDHDFGGEFHLTNLEDAVSHEPLPHLAEYPEVTQELAAELRPFDGHPYTGTGHHAYLRINGETTPEIWFDTTPTGPLRMDLDYRGYLEALRMTKGTFSWQFLYVDPAEVCLSNEEFESHGRRLASMLDVFPRLFPHHDYTPLRQRLEARL